MRGTCSGKAECVPHRQGDSWFCSRSATQGGPCADGPLPGGTCSSNLPPCQPVRSLRLKRRILIFSASALSLAIILCNFGGPRTREFISPGPLTFKHGTVTQTCEACHTGPRRKVIAMLFDSPEPAAHPVSQSKLCLDCHNMGTDAAFPHGAPADDLLKLTQRASGDLVASAVVDATPTLVASTGESRNPPLLMGVSRQVLGKPIAPDGTIPCAACHREHHGRDFDLTALGNAQCQTCHVRQFDGMGHGHPEFKAGYPFRSRTAIYFDHESHLGRHFKDFSTIAPQGVAPTTCVDCHAADSAGQRMVLKSFDQTCASCHLGQVLDTTLGGIRLLNLPALDTDSLTSGDAAKAVVGEWNQLAAGEATPFLRLLIAGDSGTSVTPGTNLADLSRASPVDREAAARFARSIKELLYDMIVAGDGSLHDRLAKLTDPPLSAETVTLLAADIPPSTLRIAQERWLPALLQEVPALRAGQALPSVTEQKLPFTQPSSVRWKIHDADCSIQYLPRRHTDLFLQTWLDLSGREYASKTKPEFAAVFDYLASPYSPGHCTSCHSVEARPDGSRIVKWTSSIPSADMHSFSAFSHSPHVNLVGAERCESCHQLDVGSRYAAGFRTQSNNLNFHPEVYESNFRPIEQASCVECHVPGKASDSCLLCHNYHVGHYHSLQAPIQHFRRASRRVRGNVGKQAHETQAPQGSRTSAPVSK